MSWVLSIDFGTSFTAGAIGFDGGAQSVMVDGGLTRMLSNVMWQESTGELLLGEIADNASVVAPWCYERAPKRKLGQRALLLGDQEVRVADAVGAVLRRVADDAAYMRGGEQPAGVRLTYPVRWGEERKSALLEAASVAGLAPCVLVPEPVAAAMFFARGGLGPGQCVAVYDLGGGTFDSVVLERTDRGFEPRGAPGGVDGLGGDAFDDGLYRALGSRLPQEEWTRLRTAGHEDGDLAWAKAKRQFQRNIRRAKELLSRVDRVDVDVPSPVNRVLPLSRAELETEIRSELVQSVDELARTVSGAGLEPRQLAAVYLVGGSSQIPLVREVISAELGIEPLHVDDPKTVICRGAALELPAGSSQSSTSGRAGRDDLTVDDRTTKAKLGEGRGSSPATTPDRPRPEDRDGGGRREEPPTEKQRPTEKERTQGGDRRRRWAVLGGIGGLIVAAGVAIAVIAGGSSSTKHSPAPHKPSTKVAATTTPKPPPPPAVKPGTILARVPWSNPWSVDVSPGTVWVADLTDRTVGRIDASTNRQVGGLIHLSGKPDKLDVIGSIVVVHTTNDKITRIDASTGRVLGTLGDAHNFYPEFSSNTIWVVNAQQNGISHVDPRTGGQLGQSFSIPGSVGGISNYYYSIAADNSGEWFLFGAHRTGNWSAVRINPATGLTFGRINSFGGTEYASTAGDGSVWAVDGIGSVFRMDDSTGNVTRIQVGSKPEEITVEAGAVWVGNNGDGTVSEINPQTNAATTFANVGTGSYGNPADLAATSDAVWVADYNGNTVMKIAR